MAPAKRELVMMFTGGVDTTLAAARILEAGECDRLHLLTFCNGICVCVDHSKIHAAELAEKYGAERIVHKIIYVTEMFTKIRNPYWDLVHKYNSTLVFDLCCRLSMETGAIIYALDHEIAEICDGTNIDQGDLFLERPEYLRVSGDYFASFGIRYFSPVYGPAGGRMGRREELVHRGFTVGPKMLERLNITTCLFTQPFCLMAFHTFFFTSFLRKAPFLKGFIARHNLTLEKAIELRVDRQNIAWQIVKDHMAFNELAGSEGDIRIQDHFCTTKLCGTNAVEITLPRGSEIDLDALASAWNGLGEVIREVGYIAVRTDDVEVQAYAAGYVMIVGTRDREKAVAIYRRTVAPCDRVFKVPGRSSAVDGAAT